MFDKNNICRHAGGEDKGYIMCCYYGEPEHIKMKHCGEECYNFEKQTSDIRERLKEYISKLDKRMEDCEIVDSFIAGIQNPVVLEIRYDLQKILDEFI